MGFGSFGIAELLVIALVIFVVFGAGKLPQVMKDLGNGVQAFKKASQEADAASGSTPKKPLKKPTKKTP